MQRILVEELPLYLAVQYKNLTLVQTLVALTNISLSDTYAISDSVTGDRENALQFAVRSEANSTGSDIVGALLPLMSDEYSDRNNSSKSYGLSIFSIKQLV